MTTYPFTLAVGDSSSSRPSQEVTSYESWTVDNNLDDGCSISFTCRGDSTAAQLIDELVTDIWLYRDGSLQQRFRVTSVNQQWGPDGEDDVTVSGTCYRRLLKKSHVRTPLTFTNTSQGTIVWDLIQHAQAATGGNLGLTLGSAGPVVLRDRTYDVGQNIFDAITELTKIDNGITWNVNADLEVYVYPITGTGVVWGSPAQLGVTTRSMSRPSSASKFANAGIVSGDSQATTPIVVQTAGINADPRGRWERFVSSSNAKTQAQLTELADGLLEESISPVTTWELQMEPSRYFYDSEYETGDEITIVVPRSTVFAIGTPAPRVQALVISRSVSQNAAGEVTVRVSAIELPS